MYQINSHVEITANLFGKILCAVNRAVLATGTTKANHKFGKSTLYVFFNCRCHNINSLRQKKVDCGVRFQKVYYGLVAAGKHFVLVIAAGIVLSAAVEHKATASFCVGRNAFFVREADNGYRQSVVVIFFWFFNLNFVGYLAQMG